MRKHTRMILLYVFAMYAGMMAANDGAQAQDMAWPVAT